MCLNIVWQTPLVARVWAGAKMMIHGYSKLRNLKHAAEEAKKTLGVPIGATYTATILEVLLILGYNWLS
jgi:uncharacterized membrane protein YphA (DoxX/SURF4 family)